MNTASPELKSDNLAISDYSIALAHIHSMRIQCSAAIDTLSIRRIDSPESAPDPAVEIALGKIYDALIQAGDDLASVALERGESIGDYR